MTIRIAIADDHPVVRKGLAQFFADEDDLEVIAQCADGEELVEVLRSSKPPDVAIIDLRMRRMGALDVLRYLREKAMPSNVIILAGNIGDDEVVEAMRLGVKGILLKEMAPNLLVQSIRKVAAGGVWLEKDAVARAMERLLQVEERVQEIRQILTAREIDVVRMLAKGLVNREIAEKLFISEGTVKTHLHTIYEKLGVKGRLQLVKYAGEHGLLE